MSIGIRTNRYVKRMGVDAARFDGVLVDANVVVAGETLSLDMSEISRSAA